MPAKKDDKSVFDVSKPGSTAPSSSSKPIIVSHKPIIKDPTVVDETDKKPKSQDDQDKTLKAPSEKTEISRVVIKPLEQSEDRGNNKSSDQENQSLDKQSNDSLSEQSKEKKQEEAVVDAVISQASDKKQKKLEQEEIEERRERINKLVESKKYFVKVKQPKAKRNKRALLLFILLVLSALIGFVLAADAGIIDVKVPFDFIKKSQTSSVSNSDNQVDNSTVQDETIDNSQEVSQVARDNDTERESDVKVMASKAQEYYAQNGFYPSDITEFIAIPGLNKESTISPNNLPAVDGGNILGECILEPSASKNDHYCYVVSVSKDQFEIWYFNETENQLKIIKSTNENNSVTTQNAEN